jgi:transposase
MLSEKKIAQINTLYKKGITIREIAELIPCGQSTIFRILEPQKKRGSHSLRINRAKLKKLPKDYMSQKFSIKDLLKKYGVKSEQTLYRILDEFKVPRLRQIIKASR